VLDRTDTVVGATTGFSGAFDVVTLAAFTAADILVGDILVIANDAVPKTTINQANYNFRIITSVDATQNHRAENWVPCCVTTRLFVTEVAAMWTPAHDTDPTWSHCPDTMNQQ
jgi:hypothetical protein